jgi:restriction system protein
MAVWLVRAGRRGERENFALEHGVATIDWHEVPNIANINSRDDLRSVMRQIYPDAKPGKIQNYVAQVWAFADTIKQGDLIAMPLKGRSTVAFGEVTGPYAYRPENPEGARHTRPINWKTEVPRSRISCAFQPI